MEGHVEKKEIKKNYKKYIIYLGVLLSIVMVTILVLVATYAQPVADQYAYMAKHRDSGTVGYTFKDYTVNSGRVTQHLLIGLMYDIFGYHYSQIVSPILLLSLLIVAFTWLFSLILSEDNIKKKIQKSLLAGTLTACGILFTSYCLFDIYLWLDAAFIYLLSMSIIVFTVAVLLWFYKNYENLFGKKKIKTIFFLIIAFFGQIVGESTTVIVLGISFVFVLATFFRKNLRHLRKIAVLYFTILILGTFVLIFAPGLWNRAAQEGTGLNVSLFDIFLKWPVRTYGRMFTSIYGWQVTLSILISFVISVLFPKKINKKTVLYILGISFLVFAVFSYIPIVLYFYGSRYEAIASRVLATPMMGLFIAFILIITTICLCIRQSKYARIKWFSYVLIIIILSLGIYSGFGLFKFSSEFISVISARKNLVVTRDSIISSVEDSEGMDEVLIPDAPIMLIRSDATDFSINNINLTEWFYDFFFKYFDSLSKDNTVIYGGVMYFPSEKIWYREIKKNICVSATKLVDRKYYCEVDY